MKALKRIAPMAVIFSLVLFGVSTSKILQPDSQAEFLAKSTTEPKYKVVRLEVTMYSSTDTNTASNTAPKIGSIAAPKDIAFGTEIYLDTVFDDFSSLSDTVYTVDDRGSSLKTTINEFNEETIAVCVWTPDVEQARKFGRRIMYGRIY